MRMSDSQTSFHGKRNSQKTQFIAREKMSPRLRGIRNWPKVFFRLPGLFALATLSLVLSSCSFLTGSEEVMRFDELPAHIQKMARAEMGTNPIVQVERESRFGRNIYAINYTVDDVEWELEYSADGKLLDKSLELD